MAGLVGQNCFLEYVRLVGGQLFHYFTVFTQSYHGEVCRFGAACQIATSIYLDVITHFRHN
jgi:hypothetical protein